ncbi:MAG: GNAT family N-acyltransferase [Desulfobacteraceae bacterium]|jgi:putative hemolysin
MTDSTSILDCPLSRIYRLNNPIKRIISGPALSSLDKLMSLPTIRDYYHSLPECDNPFDFIDNVLAKLEVYYEPVSHQKKAIPNSGPLIVAANHPFGGIDGLVLASILSKIRQDIRIIANHFLGLFSELHPILFPVDPFGNKTFVRANARSLLKAASWVKNGGLLVVFPAGEVSHFSISKREITDPPWHSTIGRLVHITGSPVLPVFFHGKNSPIFHAAGLVHPFLRTALLPRELLKKRTVSINYKIGHPISYKRLSEISDIGTLTSYLRFRTQLLGKSEFKKSKVLSLPQVKKYTKKIQTISSPESSELLSIEIKSLPEAQTLVQNRDFSVYRAQCTQIPHILREIGRLREQTFRATGEGTGNSIDLDRFDHTYVHIFVWNKTNQEIVGSYRVGRTDEILAREGKRGLYTHTLFKYRDLFLNNMGPALEMGRTFIRAEYQKSYSALLLLWKGIGQYIVKNMKYRYLFGAVSISKDYQSYSRKLMVSFLEMNHGTSGYSKMIKPRTPFRMMRSRAGIKRVLQWSNDIEEVSSWISGIERDDKGVPVLLRQYLKLGGKILCFNVDRDFSDVLDGLIFVDLLESDKKTLSRYMGETGLKNFLEYHSRINVMSCVA